MLAAGGLGVISVMANIIPAYTHEIVASYLRGETKKSWEMQLNCLDLVNALFCEVNPIPVKEAVNYLGFDVGDCRMPLVKMTTKNRDLLISELNKFGINR